MEERERERVVFGFRNCNANTLTTHNTILWLWFLLPFLSWRDVVEEEESFRNIDLQGEAMRRDIEWECVFRGFRLISSLSTPFSHPTSHFSAGLKSHPSYSTNTSGLTLFCTWLTARCLKYFPVCSRINCSSGNDDDDSSKKPKKRSEKRKKRTEAENWEGKQKSYRPKHVFVFDVFFFVSTYFYYISAWVSRLKMMKILIKCYDRSPLAWWYPFLLFSDISCDLCRRLDLNAELRDC